MKLGIFLKFVVLFAVMAIALGAVGVLSYKNYRQQHYGLATNSEHYEVELRSCSSF